jgi:short-subunit dehydrogenase involved in D-alanine esterification of teichoic acids
LEFELENQRKVAKEAQIKVQELIQEKFQAKKETVSGKVEVGKLDNSKIKAFETELNDLKQENEDQKSIIADQKETVRDLKKERADLMDKI